MTAIRPDRTVLMGEHIRLVPMTPTHVPALYKALAHRIVFAGGFGGGSLSFPHDLSDFAMWARDYFDWYEGNVYAVYILTGPHGGELVGTTTLSGFDLPVEAAQIGWTAYDPRVWGTAVNAEAKLLLLDLAFEHGFGRIKFQADARNVRSQAAIAGLGATFEGVVRRDRPRADGSWRDSAVYSITIDDWPVVRERLRKRLAAYNGRPVRYRNRTESPTPPAGDSSTA